MIEPSTSKLFSLFVDRGFWQRLVPDMSIEDNHGLGGVEPWKLPFPDEAGFQGLLDREGYVQMSRVVEPALAGQLSTTIAKLASLGIPPIFAMVFDAFWAPVFRLDPILKAAFGATYGILPNLWVWHIDPAASESGWRPHREIGHEALFADRRPKSLSAWIALTAATPLNGCMYVVPADRDPTYGTGDDDKHLFGLSEVRALPADAGDVFLWNQAILHWGAHASPRAASPRMSMAFEFVHADANLRDALAVQPAAFRRFEDRLRLIARQLLQYSHMYGLPPALEKLARSLTSGSRGNAR